MQSNNTQPAQRWLILLALIGAAVLGVFVVWLINGGSNTNPQRRLILSGNDSSAEQTAEAAQQTDRPSESLASAAQTTFPTPTFVPAAAAEASTIPTTIVAEVPVAEPTIAVEPTAEPTDVPEVQPTIAVEPTAEPTDVPEVQPTIAVEPTTPPTRQPTPQPPTPVPPPPAPPVEASGTTARLDDGAWQGGFRSARGYGGRSATWIYGTSTEYSTMEATFRLKGQPASGTATLSIEGMDSEGRGKTPIRITVNGTPIFSGANPLPDDDLPIESGTWATARFPFDAALLKPGRNVITISNTARGAFSLPPFFMLDYADISFPQP